jgi:DNA-binding transcriptional LysR family regulator
MRDESNRNVKVDIEEVLSRDIVQALQEERAAVGVCWDRADFENLMHLPYRKDQLALAVHESHALSNCSAIAFADTLEYEHVGLHPNSAVYPMLQRAAIHAGGTITYRVIVSSFDAALRVVAANLGVSVIPIQVASAYASRVKLIPLTDAWATRQFAVCFKNRERLQPPAQRLVDHLTLGSKIA